MQKRVSLLLVSFLISLTPRFLPAAQTKEEVLCSKGIETKDEKKHGDYLIRISYANNRMCQRLEILRLSRRVFHEEDIGNHYDWGDDEEGNNALGSLIGNGTQLVVRRWTGGAHCCTALLIFDLGKRLRKIAEIDGGNYAPEIIRLPGSPLPVIRVADDFLAYRFSSFGLSATAEVFLKYANGRYSVAPEFMRKPAPSKRKINSIIGSWRRLLLEKKTADWPPPNLVQSFTNLVYSGNKETAVVLLKRAWPTNLPGEKEFVQSCEEALADSKYYSEFEGKLSR